MQIKIFRTLTYLFYSNLIFSLTNFKRVIYSTYLVLEEAYLTFLNCHHKSHHSSYILPDFNAHNYTKYKFKHTLVFQGTPIEKHFYTPARFCCTTHLYKSSLDISVEIPKKIKQINYVEIKLLLRKINLMILISQDGGVCH